MKRRFIHYRPPENKTGLPAIAVTVVGRKAFVLADWSEKGLEKRIKADEEPIGILPAHSTIPPVAGLQPIEIEYMELLSWIKSTRPSYEDLVEQLFDAKQQIKLMEAYPPSKPRRPSR